MDGSATALEQTKKRRARSDPNRRKFPRDAPFNAAGDCKTTGEQPMNLRRRAKPEVFGFQIAPMVDILLVLLVFFIVTWNFALSENELDVKIPSASNAKPSNVYVGQVVLNVKTDGSIVLNR